MKIFGQDSTLMRVLALVKNLMVLGIIATLCCIPVVTIGASLTAAHYVALRLVRGEEGYIWKDYFRSFRLNMKQSTIIWGLYLVLMAFFVYDMYIINTMPIAFGAVVKGVLVFAVVAVSLVAGYAFPLLARFSNTVRGTLKNALLLCILRFPTAVLLALLFLLPLAAGSYFVEILPLTVIFGVSLPAYLAARLYNKYFLRLEAKMDK